MYEVAEMYGTPEAKLLEIRNEWRRRLMAVLGGEVARDGITLTNEKEYISPLYEPLWTAWQRASKDPDDGIPMFIREGVPLGMEEKIPTSNGIFPEVNDEETTEDMAPELESMKDIQNHVSVTDQPEDAKIEIDRYGRRASSGTSHGRRFTTLWVRDSIDSDHQDKARPDGEAADCHRPQALQRQ